MRSGLKRILSKNKYARYSYKCIEGLFDNKIMDHMIYQQDDYRYIEIENKTCYGNNLVYLIQSGNEISGFFAEYRRLIDALAYAELFNCTPYIVYNKKYLYAEEHSVLNTDNPYEYYFKQINNSTVDDLKKCKIIRFRECDREYIYSGIERGSCGYGADQEYIDRAARIIKKYIHLNDTTLSFLERDISNILKNKKTLGVHARGGEWRKQIKGHPVAISLEEHIAEVKKALEEYGFEQIFLATDETEAIQAFLESFGDKLVYYKDVFRGTAGKCLAFTQNERENHKYLMGLEVLRDAETLARCTGLIAGVTNVSLYARIENQVLGRKYDMIIIENKGINKTGVSAEQERKYSTNY